MQDAAASRDQMREISVRPKISQTSVRLRRFMDCMTCTTSQPVNKAVSRARAGSAGHRNRIVGACLVELEAAVAVDVDGVIDRVYEIVNETFEVG